MLRVHYSCHECVFSLQPYPRSNDKENERGRRGGDFAFSSHAAHPCSALIVKFQERRREEERKRREEKEARRLAAEAKAKEVHGRRVLITCEPSTHLFLQEERLLRAEAREAERIKEESERRRMEQERAELRARRLMEREGLLRRFVVHRAISLQALTYISSVIGCT